MTTNVPSIYAVIPLISQIIPHARALYKGNDKTGLIDVDVLGDLVNATKNVHLLRLDDPHKPVLKKDSAGNETRIMMWGHPKNPLDSDYILALVCKKSKGQNGQENFIPDVVIRGSKANVLIVGGMSCCGTAVQTHWTQVLDNGQAIDSARVPLSGLPHPEHLNWLKGKVHLADTQNNQDAKAAVDHMVMDVLSARYPDKQEFKHACSTGADYIAYTAVVRSHTLG